MIISYKNVHMKNIPCICPGFSPNNPMHYYSINSIMKHDFFNVIFIFILFSSYLNIQINFILTQKPDKNKKEKKIELFFFI